MPAHPWLDFGLEPLVQHIVEVDVRQQRADNASDTKGKALSALSVGHPLYLSNHLFPVISCMGRNLRIKGLQRFNT